LDSNPTREIVLHCGEWTVEQSAILAPRPYPLQLTLGADLSLNGQYYNLYGFSFSDDGAEFLSVLEKRESFLAPLAFSMAMVTVAVSTSMADHVLPLDYVNLGSLVKLEVVDVEKLHTSNLVEECIPLFFSANVKTLHCTLKAADCGPDHFEALDIVSSDLSLKILLGLGDKWDTLLTSLLNQLAQLHHLDRLTLSIRHRYRRRTFRVEP
jgi:hypothetical protein